jgi:hypothetical protein
MSINWNVTVDTPYGVIIPTYGQYGGPGYSAPPGTQPVDDLDALFLQHDAAYGSSSDPLVLAQADLELLRGITNLTDAQLSAEGHLYAGATELALIDQIKSRYGHTELFQPGEEALITQDALDNLQKGGIDPEPDEIAAAFELRDNLIEYAQGGSTGINIADTDVLVDDVFYLARNPDVLAAGVDPDLHYAQFGWPEGRDPNALFSTNGYLSAHADVGDSGVNPLAHYHQNGWKEGRDASINFDTSLYLIHNPDVKAAGVDPLEHYLAFGRFEGRQTYEAVGQGVQGTFDAEYYLLANPDVGAAGVDAAFHFQTYGWKEGRDPNAFFDTGAYLSTYTDVAAAGVNPLEHYNSFGWQEGRDPSAEFDTDAYLAAYTDVAAAGVNALQHYLQFGIYEGRSNFSDGLIV